MNAAREGEVAIGLPGDVEAIRVRKLGRIAIRRPDADRDGGAGRQGLPAEFGVNRRQPVAELVRAFVAQHLLDRGADEVGLRQEAGAGLRELDEELKAVADQVRGGLVPGIQDEDAVLQKLGPGQRLAAGLAPDQSGEDVLL